MASITIFMRTLVRSLHRLMFRGTAQRSSEVRVIRCAQRLEASKARLKSCEDAITNTEVDLTKRKLVSKWIVNVFTIVQLEALLLVRDYEWSGLVRIPKDVPQPIRDAIVDKAWVEGLRLHSKI